MLTMRLDPCLCLNPRGEHGVCALCIKRFTVCFCNDCYPRCRLVREISVERPGFIYPISLSEER